MKKPDEVKNKVFCSECKYYEPSNYLRELAKCKAVNCVKWNPINWFTKQGNPWEINKNNNCKLFERKEEHHEN